jgi:magnesium chelatase family protein
MPRPPACTAGLLGPEQAMVARLPFRAPHHSISRSGLVGRGSLPQPGETFMAHNGVLFLGERPEFPRQLLELLRQPPEDRRVPSTEAAKSSPYIRFETSLHLQVRLLLPCA